MIGEQPKRFSDASCRPIHDDRKQIEDLERSVLKWLNKVRDRDTEIRRLQRELELRDEVLESRRLTLVDLTHKASMRESTVEHSEWWMRWNQQNNLAALKNEFQEIHDDLWLAQIGETHDG